MELSRWLRMIRLALLMVGLVVALLLLVSFVWLSRSQQVDWERTLVVRIYPINADNSAVTANYVAGLKRQDFHDLEQFFIHQADRYHLRLAQPIRVTLAPVVTQRPPQVPKDSSILESLWWALEMYYWVWRNDGWASSRGADIRIFMSFYAPGNPHGYQHSLGLQKGMIGLVNGFASRSHQRLNNFVAAHELLHTVGASDKYDPDSGTPVWPDGYADPVRHPRFPQNRVEVMAGRVQVTPGIALLPTGLDMAVIGPATAIEIGWLNPDVQRASKP